MSLVTYDEARPWAKAIRDQVLERQMPLWGAVHGIAEYQNDPSLSQAEIEMIVNWVEGGAPKGDEAYLPHVPQFASPPTEKWRREARDIPVGDQLVLKKDASLIGIRPQSLKTGESMEVTAYLPDGEVDHLLWLRNYRREWTRTYRFLQPVRLPKGAEIRVTTAPESRAILMLRP